MYEINHLATSFLLAQYTLVLRVLVIDLRIAAYGESCVPCLHFAIHVAVEVYVVCLHEHTSSHIWLIDFGLLYSSDLSLSSKTAPFLLRALPILFIGPPLPLDGIDLALQIHLIAEIESVIVTRDGADAAASTRASGR